jgi:UrcA family protein
LNVTKAPGTKVARTWTTLAAVSICMLGSVAQAADLSDSATQRTVSYGDLNLTDAAGAQVLYSRLTSAAKTVCDMTDQRELARTGAARHCMEQAMVQAVNSVNNPMLTSLYLAKTGTTEKRFAIVARLG